MPSINIGGIKVQYASYQELGNAVETKMKTIKSRLKNMDAERAALQRQCRALKAFFGGRTPKREDHPVRSASATAGV